MYHASIVKREDFSKGVRINHQNVDTIQNRKKTTFLLLKREKKRILQLTEAEVGGGKGAVLKRGEGGGGGRAELKAGAGGGGGIGTPRGGEGVAIMEGGGGGKAIPPPPLFPRFAGGGGGGSGGAGITLKF